MNPMPPIKRALLSTFIIIFFVLCSCDTSKRGEERSAPVLTLSPDPISPTEPIPLDSIVAQIDFVHLETTDNSLLSEVTKIRITDDYILVLDEQQKSLLFFARNGKFVKRIDRGDDPESPSELTDFTIQEDNTICLLGEREILFYSKDGSFKKRTKIELDYDFINYGYPYKFAYLKGDFYLWMGSFGRNELSPANPEYSLYKLNSDFKITNKYFVNGIDLLEIPRFQEFTDSLILTPTYLRDTLYRITDKDISSRFFVDFKSRAISNHSDVKAKLRSESSIAYELGNNTDLCMGVRYFLTTQNHIFFQYRCGNNGYDYIFNKISGKGYSGRYFDAKIGIMPMLFPISTWQDNFVFYSEAPRVIEELKNFNSQDKWPAFLQDKKEDLSKIRLDDNPVISIIKLKNFK